MTAVHNSCVMCVFILIKFISHSVNNLFGLLLFIIVTLPVFHLFFVVVCFLFFYYLEYMF